MRRERPPGWATCRLNGNIARLAISGVLLAPFNAISTASAGLNRVVALAGGAGLAKAGAMLELTPLGACNVLCRRRPRALCSSALIAAASASHGRTWTAGSNSGPLAVDFAGPLRRTSPRHRSAPPVTTRASRGDSGGCAFDNRGLRTRLRSARQVRPFRWPLAYAGAPVRSAAGLLHSRPAPLRAGATGEAQLWPSLRQPFMPAGHSRMTARNIQLQTLPASGARRNCNGMAKAPGRRPNAVAGRSRHA